MATISCGHRASATARAKCPKLAEVLGRKLSMMSCALLVCGLIVSPSVRFGQLAQPPLSARMCSPQPTAREPSLLTEISTILEDRCGGMFLEEIRGEMVDAFVLVSGEPAPAAGNFGDKPMPKAEIGLEQLSSTVERAVFGHQSSPPRPARGRHSRHSATPDTPPLPSLPSLPIGS